MSLSQFFFFFFFNDTATTEIYTLSLHDALPISHPENPRVEAQRLRTLVITRSRFLHRERSEEHTSELQSLTNLVCRLLLEKKKKKKIKIAEYDIKTLIGIDEEMLLTVYKTLTIL